ncbi:hypothetical protein COCC4DRAFT_147061 [Bipolaris maydis ATCC 48331]|uniref:Uncharacterized protein n=2 Tax=Cochliobolus heterostrophus TaxID=5016 RepID=M2U8F5_COCH5|nr:uncharacterized protein COCC4DRAFT_147061 [Bipolaris maydis ATCC 48331]EMD94824.1 hypothetical protein COCHEDRAFT_1090922 [Bipolaris maydis C5]ENI01883.1 hypothetical protein COCC4DRAFT_147061 [Bipolaris maydis ATCC 48331]
MVCLPFSRSALYTGRCSTHAHHGPSPPPIAITAFDTVGRVRQLNKSCRTNVTIHQCISLYLPVPLIHTLARSTDTSPCSSSLLSRVAWATVAPDRCQNLEREPKRAAAMALLGDTLGQMRLVRPPIQTRRAAKCLLHSPRVHQRMALLHAGPGSALHCHCHCQGLSLKHVVRRPAHHRLPAAPPLAHF